MEEQRGKQEKEKNINLDQEPNHANSNFQTPALEETNCTGSERIYLDQVI